MSEGRDLAAAILVAEEERLQKGRSMRYFHRASGQGRCLRGMVLQAMGEPISDPPDPKWGNKMRFDQGHDCEDRVVSAMQAAGIHVLLQQLSLESTTPMGARVTGHIDGVVCVPEHLPLGGYWFVMDVKSIGASSYPYVIDADKAKPDHIRQVSLYANSIITDKNEPALIGSRLRDIKLHGYEFGGGLVVYMVVDRPNRRRKGERIEYPKLHAVQFEIPDDVEEYLDIYDEVDISIRDQRIPPIPPKSSEMIWKGIRCQPRWCTWYSVCHKTKEATNQTVKEIL